MVRSALVGWPKPCFFLGIFFSSESLSEEEEELEESSSEDSSFFFFFGFLASSLEGLDSSDGLAVALAVGLIT